VALPSVIIVGCGAIGSATALEFARRGERVLAIDRGSVPNEHSSHHGVTRFFRMSTFEHPAYVPLLREAREGWDRLSRDTGCGMIETTGMLLMGPPGSRAVEGSTRACVEHGIPNEVLEAGELARRHATFRLPGNYTALWEPDAGCIACERAIRAMANGARSLGATIKEGARVLGWEAGADGVVVRRCARCRDRSARRPPSCSPPSPSRRRARRRSSSRRPRRAPPRPSASPRPGSTGPSCC